MKLNENETNQCLDKQDLLRDQLVDLITIADNLGLCDASNYIRKCLINDKETYK